MKISNSETTNENGQYAMAKILGIWLLAAVPMGILGWIVAPALSPDIQRIPLGQRLPGLIFSQLA
jgi:hypothetical protein